LSYNIGRIEISKILLILSFILILFSLYIVAQNQGVKGYEISLYNEYPTHFWYLIIFSIFINQIILILHIGCNSKSSISWKIAIIGMVMANSIVLLLPLIRRYALMGSGDPATHMGYIKDILYTGNIGGNTYPINHILACITHWICSLDLNICMMLYPFIFYSLYTVSFYLLLRTLLQDRTSVLVGMMLVPLLLLGGSHFTPQAESNFFLPFVFCLYFLRHSIKKALNYSILMIICSIAMAFYHPLTLLFLIVSISVMKLIYITYKKLNIYLDPQIRDSSYLIMVLVIIFFMWQSYVTVFLGTFRTVYGWLYDASTKSSMFETYTEQILRVQPDPIYLLTSFIYVYGKEFLLIIMGFMSILVVLYASRNKGKNIDSNFLAFSMIFTICAFFGYSSLFIVTGTGYGRVLSYGVLISIILISIALGYLLEKYKESLYSLKLLAIVSILLLILTYLSVFTLYYSPIIKSVGQQVTDSQLVGISMFFETRNENFQLLQGGLSVFRMKDALYGTRKSLKNIIYETPIIPDHFGYKNATYFGNYYGPTPMYLVLSTLFRISSQALIPEFPERWRFNQMDFRMLENDVTVSKTYSNRELDIYLLNPILEEFSTNEESINN
jgi:hypothetical protein